MMRLEAQYLMEPGNGLVELPLFLENKPDIAAGLGMVRFEGQRFFPACHCPGELALLLQDHPLHVVHFGVVWIET